MADLTTAFSGVNGSAAPSPWSVLSGTASIQSNRLEIVSPSVQWNAGEVRANKSFDDFDMTVKVRVPAITGNSPRFNFRWNPSTGNGYRLIVGNELDEIKLLRVDSFTETPIASGTLVMSANTDYWLAVNTNGTSLSVTRWLDGSGRPGSPTLSATDATYASGDVTLVSVTSAVGASATSAWSTFFLDDLTPDPDLPTNFTGSNGAAWPLPWTTVTGTNTIDTNRGKQVTAATSFDTARVRANEIYTNQRYDASFQVPTISSNTNAMVFDVMSDGSGSSGYRLILGTSYGQMQPFRVASYNEVMLGSAKAVNFVANTWFKVAAETYNGLVRFKVWLASSSEPSTWDYTFYDTTYTSGDIVLGTKTLSATSATGYWDDVSVSTSNPDSALPTAAMNNPTPVGQTVGYEHIKGAVTIGGSGTDDTVIASISFYDGLPGSGGTLIASVSGAPYETEWDTTAVSNGTHNLYSVSRDVASNDSISTPVTVVVNNSGVWAPGASRANPVSFTA